MSCKSDKRHTNSCISEQIVWSRFSNLKPWKPKHLFHKLVVSCCCVAAKLFLALLQCWPPLKYSFLFSSSIADESVKRNDRAMMMIECFKNEESWKTGKHEFLTLLLCSIMIVYVWQKSLLLKLLNLHLQFISSAVLYCSTYKDAS